jgi:ankyrin repeat protein
MTEVVGITISLATLVWNCYLRCRHVSSDFYDLHVDLKSLHETLVVVDEHLPRNYDLGAVRTGINHVITDIEKLLTKYSSLDSPNRKIWQQLKWGYEEVGELRQRLTLLIGLLGIRVFSVLHSKTAQSHVLETAVANPSSTSAAVVGEQIYQGLQQSEKSEEPIDTIKVVVLQKHDSVASGQDISEMARPISSSSSFASNNTTRRTSLKSDVRLSVARDSSPVSSSRTHRSSKSALMSKLSRSKRKFIAAAESGDLATMDRKLSQVDRAAYDDALIAVAKNKKVKGKQVEAVELLLRWEATPDSADPEYRRTPLIWAIIVGRDDLAGCLLKEGASANIRDGIKDRTPVMWSIRLGNHTILEKLINHNACLTAMDCILHQTPLLMAAELGDCRAAQILLEKDPQLINARDKEGRSPLALAYVNRRGTAIRFFVEKGDDTNFTFASGLPLLQDAIIAGDIDFVTFLLNNKANVHCVDADGVPALHVAVKHRHFDIAELLIERGAALEAKDNEGFTALLRALKAKDYEMVELLVHSGADRLAVDGNGGSVREWAKWTRNKRIVGLVS